MDSHRLANIIFDKGQKITESHYSSICESIDSDSFTLNEYVMAYKLKENFMSKIPYKLKDGTKVLISESSMHKLCGLNISRQELECFMNESYSNFKQIIGIITNGYH